MKLRIFILFLFLPLLHVQADVIDSLMTQPRDSIGLTSDSLVLHFLEESGIPISDNNKVKLLKSGREKFIDLFEAIREAKHHVHLEYFNFRNDSIANALFTLLAEKVKEGVEVRAMFDAFGNWSTTSPLKRNTSRKYVNKESKSSSLTRSPSLISIMPPTAIIAKLLLSTEKWHIQAE